LFSTKGISELTKSAILKKVSQFEIFNHYCKPFTQLGVKFTSELRASDGKSCAIVEMPSKFLIYKDFVTSETYSCFTYVQHKYNCTEEESLIIIQNDFNLKEKESKIIFAPSLNYVGLKDAPEKRSSVKLPITKRSWNNQDTYWQQYELEIPILKFFDVVPLMHLMYEKDGLIKTMYSYSSSDPAYSYEHKKGLRKVLRPFTERSNKWISNVPRDVYSGYNQLEHTGKLLIITSSLKDVMIWRKVGLNAIAPQGESIIPSKQMIEALSYRFDRILLNYDNDKAGIKNMEKAKELLGLSWFGVDHKDPSDFVKNEGFNKQKLLKFIKNA